MQNVTAATVTTLTQMTAISQNLAAEGLLLTILGRQNEFRNFRVHAHVHEYLGNHIIATTHPH